MALMKRSTQETARRKPAGIWAGLWLLFAALLFVPQAGAQQSASPGQQSDERPYDGQLLRLAEIIGAIHYLRELCGANEGQNWRNLMKDLVAAEGVSALRRAKLVESFNRGYRGYSRTYRVCNKSAAMAVNRFMDQGAAISNSLIQDNR